MADMTVGQALGTETFVARHAGKEYPCRMLTQADKKKFEAWVIDNAFMVLAPLRKYCPDEYDADKKALIDAIKGGQYCFHSQSVVDALNSPAGGLALMAILYDLPEGDMADLVSEDAEAFAVPFQAALAASFPSGKGGAGEEKTSNPFG